MVEDFKIRFNMVDREAAILYFDTMFELARKEEQGIKEADEYSALSFYN